MLREAPLSLPNDALASARHQAKADLIGDQNEGRIGILREFGQRFHFHRDSIFGFFGVDLAWFQNLTRFTQDKIGDQQS